ncbi:hypothetical protein NA56DRAFT_256696 [Hyaloscypha hepaticicola]|uniref:Uncharacterized protein n=1 Tax=Hyaloscypha hepaticicola TaxID=2082293 RepID=A0A2J6PVH8_9HELO|nr:hypothetical protein NA56DRAFT_256696 [Hyaloscypha hepaticicola]
MRNAASHERLFKSARDRTFNSAKDDKLEIEYSAGIGYWFSSSKEKVNIHRRLRKGVLPHIPLVIHQPGYWKCHVDHCATWFQLALIVCAPVTAVILHQMNLSVLSEIGNLARD